MTEYNTHVFFVMLIAALQKVCVSPGPPGSITKVHLVKAMVFPVVMYGCDSWTVKKAECRRIDAFVVHDS